METPTPVIKLMNDPEGQVGANEPVEVSPIVDGNVQPSKVDNRAKKVSKSFKPKIQGKDASPSIPSSEDDKLAIYATIKEEASKRGVKPKIYPSQVSTPGRVSLKKLNTELDRIRALPLKSTEPQSEPRSATKPRSATELRSVNEPMEAIDEDEVFGQDENENRVMVRAMKAGEFIYTVQKTTYSILEGALEHSEKVPLAGLTDRLEESHDSLVDAYVDLVSEYCDNEMVQMLQSPVTVALVLNLEILGGTVIANRSKGARDSKSLRKPKYKD